jgi:hypothetical protein
MAENKSEVILFNLCGHGHFDMAGNCLEMCVCVCVCVVCVFRTL